MLLPRKNLIIATVLILYREIIEIMKNFVCYFNHIGIYLYAVNHRYEDSWDIHVLIHAHNFLTKPELVSQQNTHMVAKDS